MFCHNRNVFTLCKRHCLDNIGCNTTALHKQDDVIMVTHPQQLGILWSCDGFDMATMLAISEIIVHIQKMVHEKSSKLHFLFYLR